jgi:hypothetical protein
LECIKVALIGRNELARMVGATPAAVLKAANSGRITVAKIGNRGRLYDSEQAVAQWNATKEAAALQNRASHMPKGMQGGRPKKQSNVETSDVDNSSRIYLKARAAEMAVRAKRRELDLKVRRSELIEKTQVEKDGAELGAIIQGYIQAFPDRHSDALAGMNNRHDVYLYLQKELNEMIVEIRTRCGIKDNVVGESV